MKENIRAKLLGLCRRLEELDAMLAAPDAADDMKRFTELSRERAEIEPVVLKTKEYEQTLEDIATAEEMAKDPEVAEFAREEMLAGKKKLEELEQDLQILLLPRDPDDNKNTFLEIRAGTGGEESALFAGDLLRMYMRYAERSGWRVEIVSKSDSDLGGYREVICRIIGEGAYSRLKFESGGHRVQRVPETEAQGRVHTSACTVAVMPEADEVEAVKINPQDLRIDVYRASGAGGQHVQKTDSAVRITHLPTGLVVECQDERSQRQNKERAMSVLANRLYAMEVEKRRSEEASTRKSLIGSGDRSERIRTYNYPQGRVTDHRINLTLYKLGAIMDGDLDEILTALQTNIAPNCLPRWEKTRDNGRSRPSAGRRPRAPFGSAPVACRSHLQAQRISYHTSGIHTLGCSNFTLCFLPGASSSRRTHSIHRRYARILGAPLSRHVRYAHSAPGHRNAHRRGSGISQGS